MRAARWLTIPAVIGVLIVVGLAVSTESRDEFTASQLGVDQNGAEPDQTGADTSGRDDTGQLDDGSNLEISSTVGRLGIELGADQPIARASTGDGNDAEPVVLQPVGGADGAGYRLTGDGQLQPVAASEIAAGDLVVQPVDDGVDVLGANQSRVEIRPGTEQPWGVGATAIEPGGDRELLVPDADGIIDLGDGVTLVVPIDQAAPPTAADTPPDDGRPPWRWILLAALVAAALAVVAVLFGRRPPDQPGGATIAGGVRTPAPARFDELLALLAVDADPARAIRVAFGVAERGMGPVPARLSTETPFEWNARVVEAHPELAAPLASLCDLFAAVRFAPERPTIADRDTAVAALRTLATAAWNPNPSPPSDATGVRA